jgi:hypothetical protein
MYADSTCECILLQLALQSQLQRIYPKPPKSSTPVCTTVSTSWNHDSILHPSQHERTYCGNLIDRSPTVCILIGAWEQIPSESTRFACFCLCSTQAAGYSRVIIGSTCRDSTSTATLEDGLFPAKFIWLSSVGQIALVCGVEWR